MHRFRFSLRTLLLVALLSAFVFLSLNTFFGPTLQSRLQQAVIRGDQRTARWCLFWGADIDQGDWTPLMHATFHGQSEMVEFLAARGADLDHVETRDSYTALRLAEFNGDWAMVKLLVRAGASDHVDDGRDWFVINYARHAKREDVVDVLRPWHQAKQTQWQQRQQTDHPPPTR
ncbi:MAG: ankyrin repeat domain-containing protein [Pirellulaceae bacterium]|nr:ankyrin repeat domain-containing protein [Pirellulaceae bacterium]